MSPRYLNSFYFFRIKYCFYVLYGNISAIDGFGGVPAIRPLETLHNALSLKQLDSFLDRMTTAPIFRTPSSTPPRYPSTPLPTPTNGCGLSLEKGRPLKLQSPSNSKFLCLDIKQFPQIFKLNVFFF